MDLRVESEFFFGFREGIKMLLSLKTKVN